MIIVSDTSPIANLVLINQLELLATIFQEIIIPTAVDNEIRALRLFDKDISSYENASWIRIIEPTNTEKINNLLQTLDEGEAQAIALSLEIGCDMLLIDERLGTNAAREEGLQTIGLIGVLIKAKQLMLLDSVTSILQELRIKAGFWIGEKLQTQILKDIGEL